MLAVDFKKWQCTLSLFLNCSWWFKNSTMSPAKFKKRLCRPVEFKGQGPHRCEGPPYRRPHMSSLGPEHLPGEGSGKVGFWDFNPSCVCVYILITSNSIYLWIYITIFYKYTYPKFCMFLLRAVWKFHFHFVHSSSWLQILVSNSPVCNCWFFFVSIIAKLNLFCILRNCSLPWLD